MASRFTPTKKPTLTQQSIIDFDYQLYQFYLNYKKDPTSSLTTTDTIVKLVNGITSSLISFVGLPRTTQLTDAFDQWKSRFGTKSTLTAEGVTALAGWQRQYIAPLIKRIRDQLSNSKR